MNGARIFRQAAPARPAWNVAKTLLQIVVMWGMALVVVPLLIERAAAEAGIAPFRFPLRREVGAALFLLFSAGNLYTGVLMAWRGGGTPLPLDSPRRLVLRGPYAHVRNPMAIGGLGQGLGVGVWLGSWPVLLYVLAGGLLWNFVARPLEEADLVRRFGSEYEDYRRAVRCWIPRLKPYRPEDRPPHP